MDDRIQTRHPQGKQGTNIAKGKYEIMKTTIIAVLHNQSLTHTELVEQVTDKLRATFDGSIGWYLETVKLDLEARRVIERDTTLRPARYRISQMA
ncbi:MAG: hypothetical protein RIG62_16490 [Cyclobacteriaceae bacterium]